MKQVCRKLKLKKFKTEINKEIFDNWEGKDYLVVYQDGSTKHCLDKTEVYHCLEKDHIKPIYCIFDMTDRIIINRDIVVDTDNI